MSDAVKSPLSFSTFKFNVIGNNPLFHRISAAATQDQSALGEGEEEDEDASYADMDNASAAEPPDLGLRLLGRLRDDSQSIDSSRASFHPGGTFSHAYAHDPLETRQSTDILATRQTFASAITSDDSGMDLQRQDNTEAISCSFITHEVKAYTNDNDNVDASGIMLQVPQATASGSIDSSLPTPPPSNSLLSSQNDVATSNKLGRSSLPADPFSQLSQLIQEEQAAWGEVLEGKRTQLEGSPSDMSISPLSVSRSPSVLSERFNGGRFAPAAVYQGGQSHLAPRTISANDANFASTQSEATSLGKRKDIWVAPSDATTSFNEDDDPRASKQHKLATYQSTHKDAKSPTLSPKVRPERSSPLSRELFVGVCPSDPTQVMREGHVSSSFADSKRKWGSSSEISEDSDSLSSASLAYPASGETKRMKISDDDEDFNIRMKVEEDSSNIILNTDSTNFPVAGDFSGKADTASLQADKILLSPRTCEISGPKDSISREQDKQTNMQKPPVLSAFSGLPEHLRLPRQNDPRNDGPEQGIQVQDQEQGLHRRSSRQSSLEQQQSENKETNSSLVPSEFGTSLLSASYEASEPKNPQVDSQSLCAPHHTVTSERAECQKTTTHGSSRSCEMQRDRQAPTSALNNPNRLSVQCTAKLDPVPGFASNASKSVGMSFNEGSPCSTATFGSHSRAMQRREVARERPPYAHDRLSPQAHPSSRHPRLVDTYRPRTPSPEPQRQRLGDSYVPSYNRERSPPRYLPKNYNRIQPRHNRSESPMRRIWVEDRHYRPSPAPLVRERSDRCDDQFISPVSGNVEGTLSSDSRLGSELSHNARPSPTSDQKERHLVVSQSIFADSTNMLPTHDERESSHDESSRIHSGTEHRFIPDGTWDQSANSVTSGSSGHRHYHLPTKRCEGPPEQRQQQQQHVTGTAIHQQAEPLDARPQECETLSDSSRPAFTDEDVARSQPFRLRTRKGGVDASVSPVEISASRTSAFEKDAVERDANATPASESRNNIMEDQAHTSNAMRARRIDRLGQTDTMLIRNDARLQHDPPKDFHQDSKSCQNNPEADRPINSHPTTHETLEDLEANHPLSRAAAQVGCPDKAPSSSEYNQEHALEIFKKSPITLERDHDTMRLPGGDSERASTQAGKEKMQSRVGLGQHCISEQPARSDSLQLSDFRVSSPDSRNQAPVSLESRISESTAVDESGPLRSFAPAGPVASSTGRNLRDRVSEQASSSALSLSPKPDPPRFPYKRRSDPEASSMTNRPSLLSRMGNEQVGAHKLTPFYQQGQDQGRHGSSSARRGREYRNTGNVPHRPTSSALERPSLANRIT